jgi:hypothetical protein
VAGSGEDGPAHALVQALARRELIYRHAVDKGMDQGAEATERLQRMTDRELAGLQLRKLLMEKVDRDPKRLEEYYQANRGRFSLPLRLRVQRLSVPLTRSANEVMARLERARADLDAGREDFARLAAAVGGTLLEPVWEVPTQLAVREKAAASPAATLKTGRHSPPYRTGDRIEMVRVLERREPEALPLERVREQVRADFLVSHRHDEYAALAAQVLDGRRFKVVRGELDAMLKRPLASGG